MEKTAASASEAATIAAKVIASKAVAPASEEAAVASASEERVAASKAVAAFDVATSASADGGRGKIPLGWDPYEEEEFIRPKNPFDTSLEDPWAEITRESDSDVGGDLESVDTKTRQVLRRLQSGQYDNHFANGVYRCPFCTRRLGAADFNCVVRHAENISSYNPKVGTFVNKNTHFAKHKALGLHLCKLQDVAIAEAEMEAEARRDKEAKRG